MHAWIVRYLCDDLESQHGATSNYDLPGTFIGENFNHYPIFLDAIAGKIFGMTVFKVSHRFHRELLAWRRIQYFVADPEGIIFMTGVPDWLYTGILPLDGARLSRTQASRRYAEAQPRPLQGQRRLRIVGEGTSRECLRLSHYMPDIDWTANDLLDTASVRVQMRTTLIAVPLLRWSSGRAAHVSWNGSGSRRRRTTNSNIASRSV